MNPNRLQPAPQVTFLPLPSRFPHVLGVQHSCPSSLHATHLVVAAFAAKPVPQVTLADPHVVTASNRRRDGRQCPSTQDLHYDHGRFWTASNGRIHVAQ